MTHEELLATIDWIGKTKDGESGTATALGVAALASLNALRAVVELHKPISSWVYDELVENHHCSCDEWNEYDMGYPCETIQAIEEQLR
jgi:hypothetical protein